MVVFTFSALDRKHPSWGETQFFGKFGPKSQNCQCKLKLGTSTNSNIQNSMALFTFSVLDRKHPSWANLVQKIKIVSLMRNLVPRLIRIDKIQWVFIQWWSCFMLETPFLGNEGNRSLIIVSATLRD